MHELAITKKLINLIEKESIKNKFIPKKIFIEIGELSSYKKDPIEFYFTKLSKHKYNLNIKYVTGADIILRKIEG